MEFAVVAPLFLVFVFGMIEYGRMVMVQQVITNASREGARRAVLDGASINMTRHEQLRSTTTRCSTTPLGERFWDEHDGSGLATLTRSGLRLIFRSGLAGTLQIEPGRQTNPPPITLTRS